MSKLPSIMIGVDFYRKARNRKWIQDNGAEAVIVLQEVWIASSQEKDCKIQKDECPYLPFPVTVSPEKVIAILESAVSVGLLESEGDFFFNSQIVKDHQNFEKKQFNYKEGRKKRETPEDSPTILPQSSENHSEERILNTEDPLKNKKEHWTDRIEILSAFPEKETRAALKLWAAYAAKRGISFDEIQAGPLQSSYSYAKHEFVDYILTSIARGYRSVTAVVNKPNSDQKNLSKTDFRNAQFAELQAKFLAEESANAVE